MQILSTRATSLTPEVFLGQVGTVFTKLDEHTLDSGNVSFGVQTARGPFFIKTPGDPSTRAALDHQSRVGWLRNATRLNALLPSSLLCPLRNVIESPHGPMLVYDWVDAELVGTAAVKRADPASAFVRFKSLPLAELVAVLSALLTFHAAVAAVGWVASDFYDGTMMYNFSTRRLTLIDLDMYRDGPFVNDQGRMFGSTRFMAPEEFQKGAHIDQRTTVFNMGRCIRVFLTEHATERVRPLLSVSERACQDNPEVRWPDVASLLHAWQRAIDSANGSTSLCGVMAFR